MQLAIAMKLRKGNSLNESRSNDRRTDGGAQVEKATRAFLATETDREVLREYRKVHFSKRENRKIAKNGKRRRKKTSKKRRNSLRKPSEIRPNEASSIANRHPPKTREDDGGCPNREEAPPPSRNRRAKWSTAERAEGGRDVRSGKHLLVDTFAHAAMSPMKSSLPHVLFRGISGLFAFPIDSKAHISEENYQYILKK